MFLQLLGPSNDQLELCAEIGLFDSELFELGAPVVLTSVAAFDGLLLLHKLVIQAAQILGRVVDPEQLFDFFYLEVGENALQRLHIGLHVCKQHTHFRYFYALHLLSISS